MSKDEILAELPMLKAEERDQLFARLCELRDEDLLRGVRPIEQETNFLDAELEQFERDGDRGTPWREVLQSIRSSGKA
jgi:hypothetical protein